MAKLGYNIENGAIPYSHSLSELLWTCPRKFQLKVLNGRGRHDNSITLTYGHAVAAGIQAALDGASPEKQLLEMMLNWSVPLWDRDNKGRSFSTAMLALETFNRIKPLILKGWEAAWFIDQHGNKRSGIEFDFLIQFPGNTSYQGHIDVILWHPEKRQFKILELKTTGSYHEETYRNKGQTLGYSLIIDHIVDSMQSMIQLSEEELATVHASSQVLYLVWDCGRCEFEQLPLTHTRLAKAEFIQAVTCDLSQIKMYQEINFFPKRGENCFNFFRACEFYGTCDLQSMRTPIDEAHSHATFTVQDTSEIAIVIPVEDIMQRQMENTQREIEEGTLVMADSEISTIHIEGE